MIFRTVFRRRQALVEVQRILGILMSRYQLSYGLETLHGVGQREILGSEFLDSSGSWFRVFAAGVQVEDVVLGLAFAENKGSRSVRSFFLEF